MGRPLRVLHFADLHVDESTLPNSLDALPKLLGLAQDHAPDLIVNAGDLAMRRGHLPPWVALELRRFHVRLAKIAPVVVVEGNHDMVHDDRHGTVRGALGLSEASEAIHLATAPIVVRPCRHGSLAPQFSVACLPYPSRKRVLASLEVEAGATNERMGELLGQVAAGLALECGRTPHLPAILVFHGTVSGAKFGDERLMTTEMDALLEESTVPPIFGAIMCGHIHKPQTIVRASYAGSPVPLGFSEETYEHGALLWTFDDDSLPGGVWSHRFLPIEPTERLLTLDYRGQNWQTLEPADVAPNTRVRVLLTLGRHEDAQRAEELVTRVLQNLGAEQVKVVIERTADDLETPIGPASIVAAPDASVDALMALWAERTPEARECLADLTALAREIEDRLPPESRNAKNAAEYTLEEITLSNWRSFGLGPYTLDLEDLGRLVVVEGENASGKSNLMEAEAFALWGRTIRGRQTLADLIRKGTSEATVAAVFHSAGERWRVTRRLHLRPSGAAACDLSLERWHMVPDSAGLHEGGTASIAFRCSWEPANGGIAAETEDKLQTLVGSLELYLSTRFASQGDVDRILSLSGAELKDTLQEALNTAIFTHRERAGTEVRVMRSRDVVRASATVAARSQGARDNEELEAKIDNSTVERQNALAEFAQRTEASEAAQRALGIAEEWHRTTVARLEEHDRAKAAVDTAIDAAVKMENSRGALLATIGDGAHAQETVEKLPAMRAEITALERATEAQREKRTRAHGLREAARAARDHADRVARQTRAGADTRAREDLETREHRTRAEAMRAREIANVEHLIRMTATQCDQREEDLRRRAGLVERAPFGEKCVDATCPLLRDAVAARDELAGQPAARAAALAPHNEKLLTAQRERGEDAERWDNKMAEQFERHTKDRLLAVGMYQEAEHNAAVADQKAKEAEALLGGRSDEEHRLERLRAEHDEANREEVHEAAAAGRVARSRLEALDADLAAAQGRVAEAQATVARLGPAPSALEDARRLAAAKWAAEEARRMLQDASNRLEALGRALAAINEQIVAENERRAGLEKAQRHLDDCERKEAIAGLYCMAVGKSGLPYMILERALPTLERHANGFLGADAGDVDLRVEIEPFRALGSGERRTEVAIRYRNRYGLHVLAAASGFERAALGYALRAAMAQMQAEAHGMKVTHFVADEGWGAFDERNLLMGQRMLQRMADEFRRVVFISHVGTIREIAESRVQVIADGAAGSSLVVTP